MTSSKIRKYFTDNDFPVLIDWYSGKASGLPDTTYHEELELQIYFGGAGSYFIGNQTYPVARNTALIVHKHEVHSYAPDPGSFVERASLVLGSAIIRESSVAQCAAGNLAHHYYLALTEREAVDIEYCLRVMREECRTRAQHWDTVICRNIERILIILDRARSREAPVGSTEPSFVKKVIAYVEDHLAEKLTLARVGWEVGMSAGFFSRSFKKCAGMGFQQYLIHRRIVEARKLLKNTDLKMAAVARNVGFVYCSTFNRDFKSLTGFTPSAYRTSCDRADASDVSSDGS